MTAVCTRSFETQGRICLRFVLLLLVFYYCSDSISGFIFIQFYDGFLSEENKPHPRGFVEKFGEKVEPWTQWSSGFNGTDLLKEPIKLHRQYNSVRLLFRYYRS